MSVLRRLREALGLVIPAGLDGVIPTGEDVIGTATTDTGATLAVTHLGLWVAESEGTRRIGWHLISKAVWSDGVLTVTESDEVDTAGDAVILVDRDPVAWSLSQPGKLPELVRERVDGSIRARHRKELDVAGAWFVLRKIPGCDGVVLQARPDPGADREAVAAIATEAAAGFRSPEQ